MEPLKRWLDRLLVADVFVVIGGAFWFLAAVLCEARGIHQPWRCSSGCGSRCSPHRLAVDGRRCDQRSAGLVAAPD